MRPLAPTVRTFVHISRVPFDSFVPIRRTYRNPFLRRYPLVFLRDNAVAERAGGGPSRFVRNSVCAKRHYENETRVRYRLRSIETRQFCSRHQSYGIAEREFRAALASSSTWSRTFEHQTFRGRWSVLRVRCPEIRRDAKLIARLKRTPARLTRRI